MNDTPVTADDRRRPASVATPGLDDGAAPNRLRFELIFASVWLGLGLFVLPAVIYGVGTLLLGPYGEGQGLGRFYADFFADLAEPTARTWALALGPLILVTLVRAIFLGTRSKAEPDAAAHKPVQGPAPTQTRVEPRIGLD